MAETSTTPTTETAAAAVVGTPAVKTGELSAADAREALNALNTPMAREENPLINDERSALDDDLEGEGALMAGEAPAEEAAAAVEEVAAGEAEAVETTETAEETAAREAAETAAAEAEEAAKTGDGRKRVNINKKGENGEFLLSPRRRAILAMVNDDGVTEEEAERALYGGLVAEKPAEVAKVEATKEPTVEELTAQISTVEAEYDKALEEFDNAKASKLNRQVQDLREQRVEAKLKAREAAAQAAQKAESATQTFGQRVDSSMVAAQGVYADVGKPGTPLFAEVQRMINERSAANDPIFNTFDWPELLTAKAAQKLGIAPTPAEAAAVKPSAAKPAEAAKPALKTVPKVAPKTAPVRRTVPLLSPGQVSGAAATPLQTLNAKLDVLTDPKQIKEVMREAEQLRKDERKRAA